MYLPDAVQMKQIDADAIRSGIPSLELMENAAKALCRAALEMTEANGQTAVFAGMGNNGGDGFAAARLLKTHGVKTRVYSVGDRKKMTEDTAEMERRFLELGGEVVGFTENTGEILEYLEASALIIDAVFGIGLNSEVRGTFKTAIEIMNKSGVKILAADIPSGVCADTGAILGVAVNAVSTVTFTMPKKSCYLLPGCINFGEIRVADIGIPASFIEKYEQEFFDRAIFVNFCDKLIHRRNRASHKGNFGKILMICGSIGYTGAAYLAAMAAVRTGSGLVSLGVPKTVYPILAAKCNEPMVFPLDDDGNGKLSVHSFDVIMEKLTACDGCLIGPGLGRSADITELVTKIVENMCVPLVIDADGINAAAENINILRAKKDEIILTPHEGEFMRLTGKPVTQRLYQAKEFAAETDCITVLKGYRTVTAVPDGRAFINTTGNPGMAKGGSGDVLAGMITSLIGQGIKPEKAAAAAVFLHGAAGDICAARTGEYGMTPEDLLNTIPEVMKRFDLNE